jgi:hypothetical protein
MQAVTTRQAVTMDASRKGIPERQGPGFIDVA